MERNGWMDVASMVIGAEDGMEKLGVPIVEILKE